MQRVASEQRVVILDKARPLNESIEQLIMKEIESTWINELQRYESLKEDQMPVETVPKGQRTGPDRDD